MARRRMLEVSIAYDEHLNSVSEFAELIFYRILPHSDDFGRFNGNPNIIKARTMPMRNKRSAEDIFNAVCELINVGLLRVYQNQEKTVLQFNDEAFKRINAVLVKNNKGLSEYPEPEKWLEIDEYIEHVKATCLTRAIVSKKYKVNSKKQKVESNGEEKRPEEIEDQTKIWFEIFWKTFTNEFGEKGSKKDAYEQFLKMNINQDLFDKIISAVKNQIENKKQLNTAGKFASNFPHAVRWLKKERWKDELQSTSTSGPLQGKELSLMVEKKNAEERRREQKELKELEKREKEKEKIFHSEILKRFSALKPQLNNQKSEEIQKAINGEIWMRADRLIYEVETGGLKEKSVEIKNVNTLGTAIETVLEMNERITT